MTFPSASIKDLQCKYRISNTDPCWWEDRWATTAKAKTTVAEVKGKFQSLPGPFNLFFGGLNFYWIFSSLCRLAMCSSFLSFHSFFHYLFILYVVLYFVCIILTISFSFFSHLVAYLPIKVRPRIYQNIFCCNISHFASSTITFGLKAHWCREHHVLYFNRACYYCSPDSLFLYFILLCHLI